MGDGDVVHKVAVGCREKGADSIPSLSLLSKKGEVKKQKLEEVARGDKYRVNNKHDDKYLARSRTKIVKQANKLVGQKVPYSLFKNNCEHFANDQRYGIPRSDQLQENLMLTLAMPKFPMQKLRDMQEDEGSERSSSCSCSCSRQSRGRKSSTSSILSEYSSELPF